MILADLGQNARVPFAASEVPGLQGEFPTSGGYCCRFADGLGR
jgi:hypothetical protein